MSNKGTPTVLKQDFSHLKTGRINLTILREFILQQIKRCIEQFHSEKSSLPRQFTRDKCVIIDDDIKNLLSHLQALNDLGASDIRIFKEKQHDTSDYRTTLFFVRPRSIYMDIIANMIKDEMFKINPPKSKETVLKQYGIIFVPRRSRVCEEKLEKLGVRGDVIIDELNLDFVPIDTDLLSMQSNDYFRDLYLNQDTSTIVNLAHGLITLQQLYGIIPNIFVKGDKAKQCYDAMIRMQREVPDNEKKVPTQIENLILIDRSVDFITPMMFPATYEALLDEVFNIQFNRIEVPTMSLSPSFRDEQKIDVSTKDKVAVHLLSVDHMFSNTRYQHMNSVAKLIQQRTREKKELRENFQDQFSVPSSEIQGSKLVAMREFVARLNDNKAKSQTLSTHLELALQVKNKLTSTFDMYLYNQLSALTDPVLSQILKQFDERIAWKDDIFLILRYLAVVTQCLTTQFKRKDYESIKKDLVQTYGLQYLILIHALEQTGILNVNESIKTTLNKTNENFFEKFKREFHLIYDEGFVNVLDPQDIFYIYYRYAPLSVRLIEKIVYPSSTTNLQETLNILPGATFIDIQQIPRDLKRDRLDSTTSVNSLTKSNRSNPQQQNSTQNNGTKATLVVFIGGLTYGEIAALKYLSDENNDFIIATTHFINGTTLMKSLMDVAILPI